VEKDIFAPFSASVGVENIREYEEKQLKKHQDNVKKRTALQEQRASLVAQLEYALKRDFSGVLQRLQAQEGETERDIAAQDKQEAALLEKEEELRAALRSGNDKLATAKEEREKANRIVRVKQTARAAVLEERDSLSKKLSAEEIFVERARSQLHEVLQKAHVEEIALPTIDVESESEHDDESLRWSGGSTKSGGKKRRSRGQGSTDDDDSSAGDTKSGKTTESTHFSQADNRAVVADRKKAARVDLSAISRKLKSLTKQQLAEVEAALVKKIESLLAELETMQPNMHALERFEGVTGKLKECENELSELQEKAKDVNQRFDDVKKQRQRLFEDCFKHVSVALGVIYKDLTKSSKHPAGGNAYLTLENTDEPYSSGTRFTAMPPMKRFRDMDQLSGGEKTMAALALLFSIHSYRQAPFFVLDEVDAALDNVNVKKVRAPVNCLR
jgi:structural maintenance of chromosome 1